MLTPVVVPAGVWPLRLPLVFPLWCCAPPGSAQRADQDCCYTKLLQVRLSRQGFCQQHKLLGWGRHTTPQSCGRTYLVSPPPGGMGWSCFQRCPGGPRASPAGPFCHNPPCACGEGRWFSGRQGFWPGRGRSTGGTGRSSSQSGFGSASPSGSGEACTMQGSRRRPELRRGSAASSGASAGAWTVTLAYRTGTLVLTGLAFTVFLSSIHWGCKVGPRSTSLPHLSPSVL